ncbi:MAG: flagellar basal body protein, partial [Gammaproteobacteria bacterium]|nr:flagellar basal body protein [Gammaproteobacteria bacterium]
MSALKIFDIAGSAMSAQMLRLNTVASNLANAETMATKPEDVYKARHPVFETVLSEINGGDATVHVKQIVESDTPAIPHYMPGHPMANKDGYVFSSGVNAI